MRLIFAGTPDTAVPALEALLASRHELVGVLTRADAPRGRGRRLEESPVSVRAAQEGLPVLKPHTLRDPGVQAQIAALGAEAAAVVAYGLLVPPPLLALYPWVNLHFSLLPRWRGAAPVQRAILAGDTETGACAFLLEEGLDTGPVLASLTRPIGPRETASEVLADLARTGADLLVGAFDALEDGSAVPLPQPATGVTLAPRLTTGEARVRWAASPDAVGRHVRAFHPGAWSALVTGQRVKIGPIEPGDVALESGEVAVDGDVLVGTGTGSVRLGTVAPAGKSWMEARAWARGLRGTVRFEDA